MSKITVLEKTANGMRVFLSEQDGKQSVGKWMSSWVKPAKQDEFEHARDYVPMVPSNLSGQFEQVVDVIVATLHKAAELHSKSMGGNGVPPPNIITTDERKSILASRAQAEKDEKERVEREAAGEEMRAATAAATESRDAKPLAACIRRAKRAVEFPAEELAACEAFKAELEAELKEKLRQEQLERERVEREAAGEEMRAATAAATESRDAKPLAACIRRAKRAVEFPAEELAACEAFKAELEAELKEKLAKEKAEALAEAERVEREAAVEELADATELAKSSRDANGLAKPIRRAKKAAAFPAEALDVAEALKAELAEELRAKLDAERLEREKVDRDEASSELSAAIEACEESRDPAIGLSKALRRARKAVEVDGVLLGKGDALVKKCDEEKKAAKAAKAAEAKEAKAAAVATAPAPAAA